MARLGHEELIMSTGDWDPIVKSDEYKRGWYDGFQASLKQNPPDISKLPIGPGLVEQRVVCQKCNMVWEGVMGYVCHRIDCPIQPKIIAASNKETL